MKPTKSTIRSLLAMLLLCWFLPMNSYAKEIPLSEVPKRVIDAAREAIAEFEFLKAEREWEWGRIVFELSGVSAADGVFYEVEVSRRGKILEIEKGESVDDDDYDDDDDDDDDDE